MASPGRPRLPKDWPPARLVAEFRKFGSIGKYVDAKIPKPKKRGDLEHAIAAACAAFNKDRTVVQDHWNRFNVARNHSLGIDVELLAHYDDLMRASDDSDDRWRLAFDLEQQVRNSPTVIWLLLTDFDEYMKLTDIWFKWIHERHLWITKKLPKSRINSGR